MVGAFPPTPDSAGLAQWKERRFLKPCVLGSNPRPGAVHVSGAMPDVDLKVDKFDLAKRLVRKGLDRAVRAVAFGIQAHAMDRIRQYPEDRRPIDTGAMLNSIYVETSSQSQRETKLNEARVLAAAGGKQLAEGLSSETPKALEAKVAVCVEYGVYVEMGTSRMAARPFLHPAVEDVKPKADEIAAREVQEALKGL